MTALVAADVTHSVSVKRIGARSRRFVKAVLTFGDGAKTFPVGGLPFTAANIGLPTTIESFHVVGYSIPVSASAQRLVLQPDTTNTKILAYQAAGFASHTHSLFLNNADVADGATTRINAGTNLLGANTGSDITVAGVANTAGSGGILNVAAGADVNMNEFVAAPDTGSTITIEAIGY